MRKFNIILALLTICVLAGADNVRAPKHVHLWRLDPTYTGLQRAMAQSETNGKKIDLSSQIDYAQAIWYTLENDAYYTILLENYSNETPAFQIETKAKAKVSIEGVYTDTTNIDVAYSSMTLGNDLYDLSQASMQLVYKGKNSNEQCIYELSVMVITTNQDTCIYNGQLPIPAYEQAEVGYDPIVLKERYQVTVTAENGSVTGDGEYAYDALVILTATANEGYEFEKWSNNATDNPYQFNITDDVTLEAIFTEVTGLTSTNQSAQPASKVLCNGQLLILRDGKTYNAQGEVRELL